jgi:hypothetical protein
MLSGGFGALYFLRPLSELCAELTVHLVVRTFANRIPFSLRESAEGVGRIFD